MARRSRSAGELRRIDSRNRNSIENVGRLRTFHAETAIEVAPGVSAEERIACRALPSLMTGRN
jgi:hypothetical protein